MAIYVDCANIHYGRMIMCHMIADDIKELHDMADKIGINRKWFQPSAGRGKIRCRPHYDICLSKKKLAIKNGAVEVDFRGLVAKLKENDEKQGSPEYPRGYMPWDTIRP